MFEMSSNQLRAMILKIFQQSDAQKKGYIEKDSSDFKKFASKLERLFREDPGNLSQEDLKEAVGDIESMPQKVTFPTLYRGVLTWWTQNKTSASATKREMLTQD